MIQIIPYYLLELCHFVISSHFDAFAIVLYTLQCYHYFTDEL